ncbi:hypothetical protein [Pseudomonas putida]|uniref:hypothetical protein n=1 Tax=Pseudomonas putida TaxID=303 RepID=UPI0012AC92DB|nr:hypothetical protein [Pseudomonas putida]
MRTNWHLIHKNVFCGLIRHIGVTGINFTGSHQTEPLAGHNLPQEAAQAFAQAVVDADHLKPAGQQLLHKVSKNTAGRGRD